MVVLVTCKNEDPIKKYTMWFISIVMNIFTNCLRTDGRLSWCLKCRPKGRVINYNINRFDLRKRGLNKLSEVKYAVFTCL